MNTKELKKIKVRLKPKQVSIIDYSAKKLGVSFDELLIFLLDTEFDRIKQFNKFTEMEEYFRKYKESR